MSLQRAFTAHPSPAFLILSSVLGYFATSPTPSFAPLVALITSVVLYTRSLVRRPNQYIQGPLLFLSLAIFGALSSVGPSLTALSSPWMSLLTLSAESSIFTVLALIPVLTAAHIRNVSPGVRLTLFPALWVTTWVTVSSLSPVGRLGTWSPLLGGESFDWIRRYVGIGGIDWIVAVSSMIAADIVGDLIMGASYYEEPPPEANGVVGHLIHIDDDEVNRPDDVEMNSSGKPSRRLLPLTFILLILALPSSRPSFPRPPRSSDTTPLPVACIIPPPSPEPALDRYIAETRAHSSRAKILLWPEGAVRFDTPSDRTKAIDAAIGAAKSAKVWIGVSFDERIPVEEIGHSRDGMRRNGIVLVGPEGPVLEYHKRHLVPFTESYSSIPGDKAPPVYTIDLPPPPHWKKIDWAPAPGYTRPIAITALICLDFSHPIPTLPERPALILAPAATWDLSIGYAMYELARARAEETGSKVLWCDGGDGAVSGVVGGGETGVQVGRSTWIRNIGIEWPYDDKRTVYAVGGNLVTCILVWTMVGLAWVGDKFAARVEYKVGYVAGYGAGIVRGNWNRAVEFYRLWREERRIVARAQETEDLIQHL